MSIQRSKSVRFVALISRDDKPLYIQSFDDDTTRSEAEKANEFLKYNFLAHMTLDIFSSPSSLEMRESQTSADGVLLLFIQDGISVYGYETNNLLKIVIGLGNEDVKQESEEKQEEEEEQAGESKNSHEGNNDTGKKDKPQNSNGSQHSLKELIAGIHKSYLKVICNPFFDVDEFRSESESLLKSPTFDKNIVKIVNTWNNN